MLKLIGVFSYSDKATLFVRDWFPELSLLHVFGDVKGSVDVVFEIPVECVFVVH